MCSRREDGKATSSGAKLFSEGNSDSHEGMGALAERLLGPSLNEAMRGEEHGDDREVSLTFAFSGREGGLMRNPAMEMDGKGIQALIISRWVVYWLPIDEGTVVFRHGVRQ